MYVCVVVCVVVVVVVMRMGYFAARGDGTAATAARRRYGCK